MKVRNNGKRQITFQGGKIKAGELVDIKNEKIAKILLQMYPRELTNPETEEVKVVSDEKVNLIERAKELKIKGVELMKMDTLRKKIAEAEEANAKINPTIAN